MLPSNVDKTVAKLMHGFTLAVSDLIRGYAGGTFPTNELKTICEKHSKILSDYIGIDLKVMVVGGDDHLHASSSNTLQSTGYSSTRYLDSKVIRKSINGIKTKDDIVSFEIDLKNLKIKGKLAEAQEGHIFIGVTFWSPKAGFSNEMTTATLLHELGHIFSMLIHLGDYAWFNHYLTEGIEILQGKKVSKLKTDVYSDKWLKRNLTPSEFAEWEDSTRTEEDARKVALSLMTKLPRHHLSNNALTAMVREEQFADLFAARLGYARPLAEFLYRFNAIYGMNKDQRSNDLIPFIFGSIMSLGLLPILTALITSTESLQLNHYSNQLERYDDDIERVSKLKRELIQQLKITTDQLAIKIINNDIETIEELIKNLHNNRTVYSAFRTFFAPRWRRAEKHKEQEQVLEQLVNNDLFIKATKVV